MADVVYPWSYERGGGIVGTLCWIGLNPDTGHTDGEKRPAAVASRPLGLNMVAALQGADLVRAIDEDVVANGLLKSDNLVDHICVSNGLTVQSPIRCWERIDESGQRLSDHPTVAIDL